MTNFIQEAESFARELADELAARGVELIQPELSVDRRIGADGFDFMVLINCDSPQWLEFCSSYMANAGKKLQMGQLAVPKGVSDASYVDSGHLHLRAIRAFDMQSGDWVRRIDGLFRAVA